MSKDKKNNSVMIRKITFLSLLVVAIVVVLTAYLVSKNRLHVIDEKNIFSDQDLEGYSEISEADFLKRFEVFELSSKKITAPSKGEEDKITNGSITIDLKNRLNSGVVFTDGKFTLKFRVGLSLKGKDGYKSDISSSYTVNASFSKENSKSSMSAPINEIYDVEQLTLYVLVTWTEEIGSMQNKYYSVLSYTHAEYYINPEPAEGQE